MDGLHEQAGTTDVIRFHGPIWDVHSWQACTRSPDRWRDDSVSLRVIPPTSQHCGRLLRPAVAWFGEGIDPAVSSRAELATRCDLFLTIGTSSLVYPASGLVQQARRHGAITVEPNPEDTPLSGGIDLVLRGRAVDLLEAVESRLACTTGPHLPPLIGSRRPTTYIDTVPRPKSLAATRPAKRSRAALTMTGYTAASRSRRTAAEKPARSA